MFRGGRAERGPAHHRPNDPRSPLTRGLRQTDKGQAETFRDKQRRIEPDEERQRQAEVDRHRTKDRHSKGETEAGSDRTTRTGTDKSKKVLKETDRDRQ